MDCVNIDLIPVSGGSVEETAVIVVRRKLLADFKPEGVDSETGGSVAGAPNDEHFENSLSLLRFRCAVSESPGKPSHQKTQAYVWQDAENRRWLEQKPIPVDSAYLFEDCLRDFRKDLKSHVRHSSLQSIDARLSYSHYGDGL